jgi:glucose dehydrogenase
MRRFLYFVVTAGLVAATVVALASASRTAPRATPAAESANAYLPKGVKPLVNDWVYPGGDLAATLYSQLKQINASNVGSLKVIWQGSYRAPGVNNSLQNAPICCPSGLMISPVSAGAVGINPGDGTVAWEYKGAPFESYRGATTINDPAPRGFAWSAKHDLVYMGQQDGSLVALRTKTGAPVWTAQVVGTGSYGSATAGESQPFSQYYDDGGDGIVLSAPNGGESPFRGHLDAFNAKTGALVWRNWTTPDPTQLPYILTWANPAEASQGGAAVWSIPAVDPEFGLVYFGTGNLFPWTGRQAGDNLWGVSLQAVDWKTGALRWYHQEMKHDIWDLDIPQPPTRFNVPINGKMTPVVTQGGKSGIMRVLHARNGAYLPHFTFTKIQTYDPTGRGKKLNGLSDVQWIPQGAAGCVTQLEQTAAHLAKCRAIAGQPVAGSAGNGKFAACETVGVCANGEFFPADFVQIAYGGTNPTPGVEGRYGPNVIGENGKDPCPTCKLITGALNKPIEGTSFAAGHTSDAFFGFAGTASGPMNFPYKTYSPQTHNQYQCVRNTNSAKGNTGSFAAKTESSANASAGASTADPRVFNVQLSAINMTNNTFAWQYGVKASTYGTCNNGAFSTAGNLVFQPFSGRTDPNAATLLTRGIAAGGAFVAFDATTGKVLWQWGSPGASFAKNGITYSYKGKQYIAIIHGIPVSTALGGIPSNQRDRITVFGL